MSITRHGLPRQAGSDRSTLLTAQWWLSDMRLFGDHNAVWNAWADRDNALVREGVRADLMRPARWWGSSW